MRTGDGAGWSEAPDYITALLGDVSYHAGVSLGSKGGDFTLGTGRGPGLRLDKSSSVY